MNEEIRELEDRVAALEENEAVRIYKARQQELLEEIKSAARISHLKEKLAVYKKIAGNE